MTSVEFMVILKKAISSIQNQKSNEIAFLFHILDISWEAMTSMVVKLNSKINCLWVSQMVEGGGSRMLINSRVGTWAIS